MTSIRHLAAVALVAFAFVGAGCRTAAPPTRVGTAPAAPPLPARVPIHARCDSPDAAPHTAEWKDWQRRVLADGGRAVDSKRALALDAAGRKQAEPSLIAGLESCDPRAATIIAELQLRDLVPALEDVWALSNISSKFLGGAPAVIDFRVSALEALAQLDPGVDRSAALLGLLASPDAEARRSAAFAARRFRLAPVRAPLLERVRSDDNYFVRSFAAESLLVLGDVYPQTLTDHDEVFQDLTGPWERDLREHPMRAAFGNGSPTPEDRAGFERAAQTLDALIERRAAQGACAPPVRSTRTHVEVQRLRRDLVAVAFDAAAGSCEKQIAILAFVESAEGFEEGLPAEIASKQDPTPVRLGNAAGAPELTYSRSSRALRESGRELTEGANVVVLLRRDGHATVKWRGTLDLRVRKSGSVRDVVDRSPELEAQLRP